MPPRLHFFDLTPKDLQTHVVEWGMKKFRAKQIFEWVYQRGVTDPQLMTNLSAADRQIIAENMVFHLLKPLQQQIATDGTRKLLLQVQNLPAQSSEDDTSLPIVSSPPTTECVMIPASNASGSSRRTACVSSQVGCPVGCTFCASGLGGLEQNLTTGQIVEQIYHLNHPPSINDINQPETDDVPPITNVVFMGMGEPLANFNYVTRAIQTLAAEWAFNLSARKITVSTVGLPNQIRRLAQNLKEPITLAISLHAPHDDLRRELIPWAESTSIAQILDAADYYFKRTKREVTLEYILLGGVNDQIVHAKQLAAIARKQRCNINLIRYNEVKSMPFNRPTTEDVLRFQRTLKAMGVNAHIRASRGRDIAAACGQLRHEQNKGA